ncbi:unnamed protein product [Ilex paraguariensis]|uniref:C-JID domain-containing protein n=1 Tax=Ilex paraguariensis TaxID=185542 RepID=A0ABC8SEA6_9AQUA
MLDLSWCPKLEKIQWPAIVVKELNVTECRSLQQITYDSEGRPRRIQHGVCIRLCYVQYAFKTKPVKEVDVRLINNVGFFSLDSMADVEVMIENGIVWSREKRSVEILWDCKVFSTYFPGREVPCWFKYKTNGATITLSVPSNNQIRVLNVCAVYTFSNIVNWLQDPIKVKVHNKSKHFVWSYIPRCYGVPEADRYILWLCHLGFWVPFEEGDEVEVSFEMKVKGQLKECGAHLSYYEEVEEIKQYFNTLLCCWDSNYPL